MKRTYRYMLCVVLAAAILVPGRAFALLDLGLFGGYSFGNKIEENAATLKPSGGEYGLWAHYTKEVLILNLGIGGYFQQSFLKDGNIDYNRQAAGLDAFLQVDLPVVPIMPYIRVGTPIWDHITGDRESTDYFHSAHIGAGLDFSIPVIPINIFAEYLFTAGRQGGDKMTGNAIHAGVELAVRLPVRVGRDSRHHARHARLFLSPGLARSAD